MFAYSYVPVAHSGNHSAIKTMRITIYSRSAKCIEVGSHREFKSLETDIKGKFLTL